jgi:hypothetical protein
MSIKIDNFINSFDFMSFSRFLKKYQWIYDGKYNEIFTIWHRPEDDKSEYELIVPENNKIKYFYETIEKILTILSDYYNQTMAQIIDDYNNSIHDKVKYSLKSDMTKNGLIPLSEGIRLLDSAKEMLVSSFLATNKKKKNYIGQRPESVNKVLDVIELGQTEEGSFVINIYIPKDYLLEEQASLFQEPSFTRKALNLMETATSDLLQKIDEYLVNNNITIFDDCVQNGVSSNLCNAISEISLNGESDVSINIEYNNGIDREAEIKNIVIDKEFIPLINKVRDYFHLDLKEDDYEIKGFVTILHQEVDAIKGEITVAAWVEEKLRKVKMQLDQNQYEIALQAHKERIELICRGTLSIKDRITRLLNVTSVLLGESE